MNIKTIAGNKIKTALFLIIIFTGKSTGLIAQSQNWWRVNGNTPSSSDFLGTTNNQSIFIRTNNITRFTFGSNGDIIFNSLGTGSSNRVLSIDASGKLSALSGTAVTSLFSSNGVGVLTQTGNDYFLPSGNLGIGIAPSPGFKLDVIGDVRISNNLLVGGGIVITDKVQAATQIKGFDVKVDHDLNVSGSSSFTGAATFKNALVAEQGLDLGNNMNFKSFISPSAGVGKIIAIGPALTSGGNPTENDPAPCTLANVGSSSSGWLLNTTNGLYSKVGSGANTAWFTQYINATNGNSYIDASGTANGTSQAGLYINSNCNSATFINPNSGIVNVGPNANFKQFVNIGEAPTYSGFLKVYGRQDVFTTAPNAIAFSVVDNSTSGAGNLAFRLNGNGSAEIKTTANDAFVIKDISSSNNAFVIKNSGQAIISSQGLPIGSDVLIITGDVNNINASNTNFRVKSDGKTIINSSNADALEVIDKLTGTTNFKLKSSGTMYTRAIEVSVGGFPDYVFQKNYKLPTIDQVENFIKHNGHLIGFLKGSEYEKYGINIAEMMKLQQEKIEELTLYIIELNKRLNDIEKNK